MPRCNYVGSDISCAKHRDIYRKVNKSYATNAIINRNLGTKVRRDTKLRFSKIMTVPVLMYGRTKKKTKQEYKQMK